MSVRHTSMHAVGGLLALAAAAACSEHAAVTRPFKPDALRNLVASEAPVLLCKKGPIGQTFSFTYSAVGAPTSATASITPVDAWEKCVEIWKGSVNGMVDITIEEQAHAGSRITDISVMVVNGAGVPQTTTHLGTGPSVTVAPAANLITAVIFTNEALAKIGDFVWSDLNDNGIQDANEPGIAGVLLTLSGGASATATTDASGHYLFDNLAPGCYSVAVTAPTGFIASPVEQGSDKAVDSNGNPTTNICVGAGGSNLTIDFGFAAAMCTDIMASNYGEPGDCIYPSCPSGSFTYTYVDASGLHIEYDQFPAPNDNSYGVNAVGWPNGHKFSDLTGSDHAGFQLVDPSGVVRLSFNVDYLHASAAAPSGYASLGVTGGDGKMLVGTADGISATTSLARNLNNINIPGLFSAAHVQQFGSVNVLVNSPPTDPAHQTYVTSDPLLSGWDFHDTYFVDISAAKLAALGFDFDTWKVQPNPAVLHNSPAKPCPPTPPSGDALSITKYEVKDKQVKITITNAGATNVYLTALALTWPVTNGKLMQVKLDGDVVYDTPDISGGTASLAMAQLAADQNKRKIDHNSGDVYTLVFEKNADTNLAHYTGTVTFDTFMLTVLPK